MTTIQPFRTLAFPGLIRDWNGLYAMAKRATTKHTQRNTSKRSTTRKGFNAKPWNCK